MDERRELEPKCWKLTRNAGFKAQRSHALLAAHTLLAPPRTLPAPPLGAPSGPCGHALLPAHPTSPALRTPSAPRGHALLPVHPRTSAISWRFSGPAADGRPREPQGFLSRPLLRSVGGALSSRREASEPPPTSNTGRPESQAVSLAALRSR